MARWTLEQYTALRDTIAQGALEVQYTDKKVRYHSLAEMLRLLYDMERSLGLVSSNGLVYPVVSKGLDPSVKIESSANDDEDFDEN